MSERRGRDLEPSEHEVTAAGEYVCYCSHVTEGDIIQAIRAGARSVEAVVEKTGAMKHSNCALNNPRGTCCHPDIVRVFNKHKHLVRSDIA